MDQEQAAATIMIKIVMQQEEVILDAVETIKLKEEVNDLNEKFLIKLTKIDLAQSTKGQGTKEVDMDTEEERKTTGAKTDYQKIQRLLRINWMSNSCGSSRSMAST